MLRTSLLLALAFAPLVRAAEPVTSAIPIAATPIPHAEPKAAAEALLRRVVRDRAGEFVVEMIPAAEGGNNVFEVASRPDGRIVLRGDTGVSVASALNHYLKHTADCHLSWCGDRLALPAKLPAVATPVRQVTPHRHRVMFNYCTLSYTCSFWDWPRWERELDFMAMNGINTPLGVIGLEGVWYNTLLREGFTDAEAREFLVGPAFGAWQWMTNIERHGGPLSREYIARRVELGRNWLSRAEELGMTPIRQGFSGNVPSRLKEKRPELAIARQPSWCGFPGSCQLDPTDPYFKKIGATFLEESVRLFGDRGHLWAADPFHESAPPKPGEKYLNEVGATIFGLMKAADPKAVWVMQAWDIRKPIADPVPKGELLVLDLTGERKSFWGHDYIRGRLHNFGGRINLHGDIATIVENPFAKTAAADPLCKGMGLFPEAIVQNPVFYDAVYDMVWRDKPAEVRAWLADYARRRYGADTPGIREAWRLLLEKGPYGRENPTQQEYSSMIAARPALVAKKSGPNLGMKIPYAQTDLLDAVGLLLAESERCGASDAYRFDMVDFTRQILSNHAQNLHAQIRLDYLRKDKAAFLRDTARFHELLTDTDTLLATRTEFLFGKWLADARRLATSPAEADLFAQNAATLVTLWGPAPFSGKEPSIFDYSWREWSGLISRYYLPRWDAFHAELAKSVERGDYRDTKETNYGRQGFRANAMYSRMADAEIDFAQNPPRDLPDRPVGDAVTTAKRLFAKYRPEIEAAVAAAPQRDAENNRLIHDLPGLGVRLGGWKPADLAAGELVFDVTPQMVNEGAYTVTFRYTGGANALDITSVGLFANGNEIARDTHAGRTGHEHRDNTYRVATGGLVFNAKYELRVRAQGAAGHDSRGDIFLSKEK